jgi:hypothetical protein
MYSKKFMPNILFVNICSRALSAICQYLRAQVAYHQYGVGSRMTL